MSTACCDVCASPLERIKFIPHPDYHLTVSLADCNLILPPHLRNIQLIANAPVVRCSNCHVEDQIAPEKIFQGLAHIKAFHILPNGYTLRKLRDHYDVSRSWLSREIGYDSDQSIYRFEKLNAPVPRYSILLITSTFLRLTKVQNSQLEWYYNPSDWELEAIEMTDDYKFLVPLPVTLTMPPPGYPERRYPGPADV